MKKILINKKILLIPLITICIIGGTLAYFKGSNVFTDVIKTNDFGVTVTDVFESPTSWLPGEKVSKTITVTNTKNTVVAVRIKYEELWTSNTGVTLSNTIDGNNVAILNFINTDNWILESGYYYYYKAINKDETTSSLIDGVTLNSLAVNSNECTTEDNITKCTSKSSNYSDAYYQLKFTIETIQYKSYKDNWNITLDIQES